MGKALDLRHQRFGKWVVLADSGERTSNGSVKWRCLCDCGKVALVPTDALMKQRSTGCRSCALKGRRLGINNGKDRWINKQGYVILKGIEHPNARNHGYIAEHVYVMSQHLQRPLLKGVTVHHRNGIRHDNRIENLELWNKPQPTGCRVEDQVRWAKEILERYGN